MAKKTKQLTAKKEALAVAIDATIRQWVASSAVKEWVKETREAITDYDRAHKQYEDELFEYGSEGSSGRNHSPAYAAWAEDEEGPEPEEHHAPWVEAVDRKLSLLPEMTLDALETVVDDIANAIRDAKPGMDKYIKAAKEARQIPDPRDIDD